MIRYDYKLLLMKKFALIFSLLLTLSGCTFETPKTGTLSVVTTFYPLTFFAEQIGGSHVSVTNLSGSTDVHEFQPSPKDIAQTYNANLVILHGANLEPWMEAILPQIQARKTPTLALSKKFDLYKLNNQEFDPHSWLDPVLSENMADQIAAELTKLDPKNAEGYTKNAISLKQKFSELDQKYTQKLSSCQQHSVIAAHDAFGYLARRYHFELLPIAGISTEDEPSAKLFAELKDKAQKGITSILTEQNSTMRFTDAFARETGLKTLVINTLEQGPLTANKDFFAVMDDNLKTLATALDCK